MEKLCRKVTAFGDESSVSKVTPKMRRSLCLMVWRFSSRDPSPLFSVKLCKHPRCHIHNNSVSLRTIGRNHSADGSAHRRMDHRFVFNQRIRERPISALSTHSPILQTVGDDEFLNSVLSLIYAGLGFGVIILVLALIQGVCIQRGTRRILDNLRKEFLGAVLRQDACWLDANSSGSITCQLNELVDYCSCGLK